MSKIQLIIKREYSTRVSKKSFILLTLLTPLFLVATICIPLWLSTFNSGVKYIAVIDKAQIYHTALPNNDLYHFEFTDQAVDSIRHRTSNEELSGLLLISGDLTQGGTATFYAQKQADLETKAYIENHLSSFVEKQKLAAYNIPNLKEMVDNAHTEINLTTIKWADNGEEREGSAEIALIVSMLTAFIIYMFILIYGAQVMNSVVQEKSNRIVEVVISSVKPFELMMGKIIGVALVGLTQVALWVVLTLALWSIASAAILPAGFDSTALQATGNDSSEAIQIMAQASHALAGIDILQIFVLFIVYFLGGYLLYASLFAAVGSLVDNETDTQQFSLPLTIPIIFALYAATYSAQNPDGPLAFWCSLIPFTSPIVMMVRIPYGVAVWEVFLSIAILALSFIGTTWLAGKIYRTGILMYGKKTTWKELWRWIRY